jgi:hypothetical protein
MTDMEGADPGRVLHGGDAGAPLLLLPDHDDVQGGRLGDGDGARGVSGASTWLRESTEEHSAFLSDLVDLFCRTSYFCLYTGRFKL